MIGELHEAARQLGDDAAVRVVVLTGEGRSFSAGADLNWMKAQFAATRADRIAEAMKLAGMLKALNELPKPLIGRINGQAFGGGLGLICGLRRRHRQRRRAFRLHRGQARADPGDDLALRPGPHGRGAGAPGLHVGPPVRCRRGRRSGASGASGSGGRAWMPRSWRKSRLISPVHPPRWPRPRRLARSLGPVIDDATLDATAPRLADTWETSDAREGVSAFFDKRAASFAG